jgi:hypothetical protein
MSKVVVVIFQLYLICDDIAKFIRVRGGIQHLLTKPRKISQHITTTSHSSPFPVNIFYFIFIFPEVLNFSKLGFFFFFFFFSGPDENTKKKKVWIRLPEAGIMVGTSEAGYCGFCFMACTLRRR